MFSVREMPWHRKGHVIQDYPQNFSEARILAGLDWDPVACPVPADVTMTAEEFRERATEILAGFAGQGAGLQAEKLTELWQESLRGPGASAPEIAALLGASSAVLTSDDDEWRRIARSDTGATLSYQRLSYNLIPNSAFGEIINAVIGSEPGKVRLETGGCLDGGRKVWMLARLDEPHQVQARGRIDASYSFPYLGMTSDHTGKASCCARLTEVRIVCGNTFGAAEAEGQRTGAVFSFSHRGDWREYLDQAREALQFARAENAGYIEAMSDLLGITVTPAQERLWLAEFLPVPPEGATDRVMANIEAARAVVRGFLDGPTVEGAGVRGTAYGLVQAAGEWADHGRKAVSWESKFNRSMLRSEPLKARAAVLAREAALS